MPVTRSAPLPVFPLAPTPSRNRQRLLVPRLSVSRPCSGAGRSPGVEDSYSGADQDLVWENQAGSCRQCWALQSTRQETCGGDSQGSRCPNGAPIPPPCSALAAAGRQAVIERVTEGLRVLQARLPFWPHVSRTGLRAALFTHIRSTGGAATAGAEGW